MKHKALSPEEKILAAYSYYVLKVPQMEIATIMQTNNGRINEACKAVGSSVELTSKGYLEREK